MRLTPVLALLVLTLALPITALAQSATPAASPVPASGDFAGLVDIGGGRQLWLECRGHGSPTVILVAGTPTPPTFGTRSRSSPMPEPWRSSPASPRSRASAPMIVLGPRS